MNDHIITQSFSLSHLYDVLTVLKSRIFCIKEITLIVLNSIDIIKKFEYPL